jgi:Membrane domain of glycerophosphoryl diester phosphodiesterase
MSVRALRPMTVGDILDQSFSLYRRNFITLVGIVAVVHVPLLVLQIAGGLLFGAQLTNRTGASAFTQTQSIATLAGIVIFGLSVLVAGLASIFETSALSVVVSERLLGNSVNLRQAYGRALSHWRALLVMIFIVGGAVIFLTLVIFIPMAVLLLVAGFFLGATGSGSSAGILIPALVTCMICVALPIVFIGSYGVSVRLLFATQAIVLENTGGIDGLRRSWRLVRGSFWRVLGITLVLSVLVAIIGQGPAYVIAIVASLLPFPVLGLVVNATAQSLINVVVLPLQFAAFTLLYYDLRIRQEGFDLQIMAQQLVPSLSGLATDGAGDISAA